MKVRVLKQFLYAHDGNNTRALQAGAEHEVRDELVPGLTEAGCIASLETKPSGEPEKRQRKPRAAQADQPAADPVAPVPAAEPAAVDPKLPIE